MPSAGGPIAPADGPLPTAFPTGPTPNEGAPTQSVPDQGEPTDLPLGSTPAADPLATTPATPEHPEAGAQAILAGTVPPPTQMGQVAEEPHKKSGVLKWVLIVAGIIVIGGAIYFFGQMYLAKNNAANNLQLDETSSFNQGTTDTSTNTTLDTNL